MSNPGDKADGSRLPKVVLATGVFLALLASCSFSLWRSRLEAERNSLLHLRGRLAGAKAILEEELRETGGDHSAAAEALSRFGFASEAELRGLTVYTKARQGTSGNTTMVAVLRHKSSRPSGDPDAETVEDSFFVAVTPDGSRYLLDHSWSLVRLPQDGTAWQTEGLPPAVSAALRKLHPPDALQ